MSRDRTSRPRETSRERTSISALAPKRASRWSARRTHDAAARCAIERRSSRRAMSREAARKRCRNSAARGDIAVLPEASRDSSATRSNGLSASLRNRSSAISDVQSQADGKLRRTLQFPLPNRIWLPKPKA